MKIEDFQDAVDRLGDDPSRWSEGLRAEAEVLILTSAAARKILDEARQLRRLLTSAAPIRAPAA